MCGSVKSSRPITKTQLNFDDELTNEQRLRFAAKANLVQAKREEQEAVNRRWAAKQKSKKPQKFSLFAWLKCVLA
ncbi:MAG: hypothetical protein ACTH7Q_09755 [Pseudoalteromonas sp.]